MLYKAAIFLSAILSFTLQLMVGKSFLAWFGGSSSVWSTLLFYFTSFLLFGYLYVFLISKLPPKRQKTIHLTLLKVTVAVLTATYLLFGGLFPENPNHILNISMSPSLRIILLATITTGLPYFIICTTSTLLQLWYTNTNQQKSPYFLYTISNIGSILGLLSYPLLIEPNLTLQLQKNIWLSFFALYLAIYYYITYKLTTPKTVLKEVVSKTSKLSFFTWMTLVSISNITLISTTSNITLSISPSPFLWLFPLTLFLLSFILGFNQKIYQRSFHLGLLCFSLFVVLANLNGFLNFNKFWSNAGILLFTQFMINFVCHAELYRSRPKLNSLPYFYLSISIGGVIGSLFCAFVAPLLFNDYYEFLISLAAGTFLFLFITIIHSKNWQQSTQFILISSILTFLLIVHINRAYITNQNSTSNKTVVKVRNFYGTLKIRESQIQPDGGSSYIKRTLFNGNIDHGFQNFDGQFTPTTYYSPESGIGQYFQDILPRKNLRIGVVGLGTGAMSGYCKTGDYYKFYEINPQVKDLSEKFFTFTKNCQNIGGAVDIVMGDARLTLEKELATPQEFDVLIIDAFTDDAIPVHLMTNEALQIYLKHLKKNGVVAFHISNFQLKLNLVLDALTAENNLYRFLHTSTGSEWYFVSSENPVSRFSFSKLTGNATKIKPWTDDYSNLLQILK